MENCQFDSDSKNKLIELTIITRDMKQYVEVIRGYFAANASNNDIKIAVDELKRLLDVFTATALSTKMSALTASLEGMDKSILGMDKSILEINKEIGILGECSNTVNESKQILQLCSEKINKMLIILEKEEEELENLEKKTWKEYIAEWFSRRTFSEALIVLTILFCFYSYNNIKKDLKNYIVNSIMKEVKK